MAKQLGIHQIKGKVDGRSYYRQSGVVDGLSRNINPAISGRVKTGEEYANTRLNNREFGQACKIAAGLGRMVTPKYRPMILPFSQATMAKKVLELIKADPTAGAEWGYRGLTVSPLVVPVEVLNAQSKLNFSDFVSDVEISLASGAQGAFVLTANVIEQTGAADLLASYGADGAYIRIMPFNFEYKRPDAAGQLDADVAFSGRSVSQAEVTDNFINEEVDVTYKPLPTAAGRTRAAALMVILMPFRTVGDTQHILQEACSFKAFTYEEELP